MNNLDLYNQIKNDGVLSLQNIFSDEEIKNLASDFVDVKEENFRFRWGEKDFEPVKDKLLNYLQKKNILNVFEKYLGKDFICYTVQYTQVKFENNSISDKQLVDKGDVTAFHHDNIGNRLKLNILLTDINENSNGLEYALSSHFPTKLDRILVKFLNYFGLFKNYEKELLRSLKRKYIDRKKYNFSEEKQIFNNYKVKKIYGKRGFTYIFDTNGFHRRAIPKESLKGERKLITYFFLSKKKFYSFVKESYLKRLNKLNNIQKDTKFNQIDLKKFDNEKSGVFWKLCSKSNLLYSIKDKDTVEYKNNFNEYFDKFTDSSSSEHEYVQKQIKKYVKNNELFFDFGCGTGNDLTIAKKYFDDVYGFEPSLAKDKAKQKGHKIYDDYSFFEDKNKYDVVFTRNTFRFCEDIHGTLNKIKDIIKDDGIFVWRDKYFDHYPIDLRDEKQQFLTFNYLTKRCIKYYLSISGFDIKYSKFSIDDSFFIIAKKNKSFEYEKLNQSVTFLEKLRTRLTILKLSNIWFQKIVRSLRTLFFLIIIKIRKIK